MLDKGGGGVAEKSWPSKKDASLSARTPNKFFKHTFLYLGDWAMLREKFS